MEWIFDQDPQKSALVQEELGRLGKARDKMGAHQPFLKALSASASVMKLPESIQGDSIGERIKALEDWSFKRVLDCMMYV